MHRAWKPIAPAVPARHARGLTLLLLASALGCITLGAARVACAISLTTPLQLVTSGAEEEALASLWRFGHGQTVFTDPHRVPFTASYFNWLFYVAYGLPAKAILAVLHLREAWLPTVCRLLTLSLTFAGVATAFRLLRRLTNERLGRSVCFALAALAFLNPLCGFWIITARPDLSATVLELGGVACALRCLERDGYQWIVGAGLFFAAAWAFKQTAVGAVAGIVLACLLANRSGYPAKARQSRAIAILAACMVISAGAALFLLGPVYRHGLYGSQLNCAFDPAWAAQHFGLAVMKMPFIAMALAGAALTWRRTAADPAWRALSLVLATSLAVDFAASAKAGAGDYYFIPLGVWSALWLGLALDRRCTPWLSRALALAALGELAAVTVVLSGHGGVINPRDPAQPYEHLAAYLATRPGPALVEAGYGNLPWISPTAPHFILGYANESDRQAGVPFESGGWRGLLRQGYFVTVVDETRHPFPDALLARYRPAGGEAGWRYFERR